ncbi:LPS assembly lipoprotein LptE [Stenoxybacter acetivorans]|uniref:LPS-assembly lipoprotein LptE n=1 Tax=Stenoxybacter acetivorans TaxID=422441 RepID=UPI000564DBA2|nr:LPS assembly lipoprotein LptE [Stenoxybacter acetivorans]
MRLSIALLLSCLLISCGFHLKGTGSNQVRLPYRVWAVDGGGTMQNILEDVLRRQPQAEVDSAHAQAVVKILNVRQDKTASAVNLGGNTIEYLLTLRVDSQAYHGGIALGEPMNVMVSRYMDYADSEVLGKQEEEVQIWQSMRLDAAEQLIRRLAYLPAEQ